MGRADGAVFVCEYGREDSLREVEEWRKVIADNCGGDPAIPIILVMNKADKINTSQYN